MYVEPMVARRDEAAYKYDGLWSTGFSQWSHDECKVGAESGVGIEFVVGRRFDVPPMPPLWLLDRAEMADDRALAGMSLL